MYIRNKYLYIMWIQVFTLWKDGSTYLGDKELQMTYYAHQYKTMKYTVCVCVLMIITSHIEIWMYGSDI